jgi:hypothetical protein
MTDVFGALSWMPTAVAADAGYVDIATAFCTNSNRN